MTTHPAGATVPRMTNESLVFLSGKRTAFGANGGALKDINPTDLGVCAGKAALAEAGVDPGAMDHVIFGSLVPSAADAIYIPRHIGLKCGVPIPVPALGINRLCGTGFQVIVEAWHQMLAGDSKLALVGGVENMSMAPYALRNARWGMKMGNSVVSDTLMESLTDSYAQAPMAITAENLAVQYGLSREEVDAFALKSQKLAAAAWEKGLYNDDIAAFEIKDNKGNVTAFARDEHMRPQTTPESLAKLKPVFKKDGVVTAGNASGIVDGGAAMVVAKESEAKRLGKSPLGRLVGYGISGCDPKVMGIGPVPAIQQLLARTKFTLNQIDLFEVNEAFAAQCLAVQMELKIPAEKLNVNGGAIAIGHPLAASGTRLTLQLLRELKRRKQRYGIASACIGGGQGIALLVEAL